MKTAGIIIPIVILMAVAATIIPGPRDRGAPVYHAPQQQHMRNVAKSLVVFEHENGRRIADYTELESYIDRKGPVIGTSRMDLIFTTPLGITRNWILYPTIEGVDYLVASPIFDWHGEHRRFAHRLVGNAEENVILKESE